MKHLLILAAALTLAGGASAQVVASDNFSYVGLLNANGWGSHSGTGFFVSANGSVATLSHGAGSREDVNLPFAALGMTDTVHASFTMNVPSTNPVNPDGQGTYFAHFKDVASAFRGRTGLLSPAALGDFQLAINADNANLGAGAAWPDDLVFDTDYTVVISWNADTGESKLWLDPYASTSPSISHTAASINTIIEQFALRQSSDHTGDVLIDNVVVGLTFDDVLCASPGSIARLDTPECATATLDVSGSAVAGNTFAATLSGGTLAVVIVGFASVNASLQIPFGCDCVLVPSLDLLEPGVGSVTLPIALPLGTPQGIQVFLQGADLTLGTGPASPCTLGANLFVGLTDAFCAVTG